MNDTIHLPLAETLLSQAADAGELIAVLLAAIAISGGARNLWRRTLGRRADRARRLQRLGVGAQLSYFESVLGEPATMRAQLDLQDDPRFDSQDPATGELLEHMPELKEPQELLWIFRECYVQAYATGDDRVVGFVVTQREQRFRPEFNFPPGARPSRRWRFWRWGRHDYEPFFGIRLGETLLADAVRETDPVAVRAQTATRDWFYADLYSFGRAGSYMCFGAATSYFELRPAAKVHTAAEEVGFSGWPHYPPDDVEWSDLTETHRFRRKSRVTIYGVFADTIIAERIWWGPHGDYIGTMMQER